MEILTSDCRLPWLYPQGTGMARYLFRREISRLLKSYSRFRFSSILPGSPARNDDTAGSSSVIFSARPPSFLPTGIHHDKPHLSYVPRSFAALRMTTGEAADI